MDQRKNITREIIKCFLRWTKTETQYTKTYGMQLKQCLEKFIASSSILNKRIDLKP